MLELASKQEIVRIVIDRSSVKVDDSCRERKRTGTGEGLLVVRKIGNKEKRVTILVI